MCTPRNNRCRATATAALLALAAPAASQPADLPEAADVVAAWGRLRDWVDAFDLPGPERPESAVPILGSGGVCVILRHEGRVLGSGVAPGGDQRTTRLAAGRAMSAALGDAAVQSLPPELRDGIGRSLLVELEVAGAPIPLLGESFEDVASQLEPGLDGVAIRRGDSWAMLFPSQMRAANTAGRAERLLLPLAGQLGLAPAPLDRLRSLFAVSVYRFRTTDLAQAAADRGPFETFRGDRLVRDDDVTPASIAALARGLIEYLSRQRSPIDQPVGITGDYRPLTDDHDPLIAPAFDQALVAWALARATSARGLDRPSMATAGEAAHSIVHDLSQVIPTTEADPLQGPATCALIAMAAIYGPAMDDACRAFADEAARRVIGGAPGTAMAPHDRAVVAAALAAMLRAGRPGVDAATVRGALDAAWESVPAHQQVGLMPWLGWGEVDYAAAVGAPPPRGDVLRSMRAMLDQSRYGSARPGPPDLHGGFALASGDRILATSQAARPAAFLATMLREPSLTPAPEAALALGRHFQTMRFLLQLSVRESCSWAYRNPALAQGGIRAAPWDSNMPVAAAALGLVAALETLSSLEALQGGSEGVR